MDLGPRPIDPKMDAIVAELEAARLLTIGRAMLTAEKAGR
jgi:hypothetical protein